jgi:hypothetical protein
MSPRRIVTAREQYDMLAPWRTAAGGDEISIRRQVNKANQAAQDARRAGDHDRADYLEHLRDQMVQRHSEGHQRGWADYAPMADEEFGERLGGAREEFEKGYLPDPSYVPTTEHILDRRTQPSHGFDYVHDAEGGPLHGIGHRDFYPGPREMPIYDTQTGEPTGRHFVVGDPIGPITKGWEPPDWTHPRHRLNRTSNARPDSHPDLHESFRTHGTVHTTGGRIIPGWRIAVSDTATQEARLADPAGWKFHVEIPPLTAAVEGARAYASKVGLPDPHQLHYNRVRQDPGTVRTVGRHFDSLPENDPGAVPHYAALAKEVNDQFDHMTKTMGIRVQSMDQDPYADVHEMVADVANNKTLKVLGTHVTGPHTYFDDATNDKFRAVHDFFGHAATGRSFDRHGEQAAYLAHAQMFSPAAHGALASETKGQNASLILNGHFPPQKLAIMHPQHWQHDLFGIPKTYSAARILSYRKEFGEALMKSLRDTGGFSFRDPRMALSDAPQSGYMVSQTPDFHVPAEEFTPDHALEFWRQHKPILDAHPDHYIGGWLQDGNVYLERSKNHPEYNKAIGDSLDRDQIALRDLGYKTDIETEQTHYQGTPGIWMARRR